LPCPAALAVERVSAGGGNVGVGFATPINAIRDLLPQLRTGKITRGMIGVQIQQGPISQAVAEERGWKLAEEKAKWYLEQLEANKMKVLPPPAALKSGLEKIGEQLTADWLKKAGPDGQAVLDAYKKM